MNVYFIRNPERPHEYENGWGHWDSWKWAKAYTDKREASREARHIGGVVVHVPEPKVEGE